MHVLFREKIDFVSKAETLGSRARKVLSTFSALANSEERRDRDRQIQGREYTKAIAGNNRVC